MNTLLCEDIYSYFARLSPNQNHNKRNQHHKRSNQHLRAVKAAQEEKRDLKKKLRALRRSGSGEEEVRTLARAFHQLVRKHSKLVQETKRIERKRSTKKERKECHKHFWKYAQKVLDDETHTSIEPTFSKETAEGFLQSTYSSQPKTFMPPAWMPQAKEPRSPFPTSDITLEEVQNVIKKSRADSTPSPFDQISYKIFKNCPSLMPALEYLFNTCWRCGLTPSAWKIGCLHLLGKKSAEANSSLPENFRPIALTSCVGKLYTSVLKRRWLDYMTTNGYLNTSLQKAFIDGVSGCTEHQFKLLAAIEEAKAKHKALCVCWLDLANAYGSVHHDLIRFSLEHYHAPAQMITTVSNLYQGLTGVVRTKKWSTGPFPMEIGVFQGDPLSVIIFNTVMNTLIDTLQKSREDLGYCFTKSKHKCNLLQYADDTCLVSNGPAACRSMLKTTEQWLEWSNMEAKVPKCCSLAIHASSGKPYDPQLLLNDKVIPYIGTTTFKFLGSPISVHSNEMEVRKVLLEKLERLLMKVDATSVTRQQKCKLYKLAILPRLAWDLSITAFPISWVEKTLQALATRYLKRWCGLAKSADTSRLFLPQCKGGLNLPSVLTYFKKLQTAKAASLMSSKDSSIRFLATQKTQAEATAKRQVFKPFQEVVQVMKEDPGANRKAIASRAKKTMEEKDTFVRVEHCRSLMVQGQTLRQFEDRAPEVWSTTVTNMPEHLLKFAMNAVTDTLPHNANLHMWAKIPSATCKICPGKQTLVHVLNCCSTALKNRRFNLRHDDILRALSAFASNHLPDGYQITSDLPEEQYSFPQQVATTDERPDIVLWSSNAIHLIELTVPFETGFEEAADRKKRRYSTLATRCTERGYKSAIHTIEVGSRGFINIPSLENFYCLLKTPRKKEKAELEQEIVRKCIACSYEIWCKRNWTE